MENILVIGGAGYIGSHTARQLAAAGYRPVILDNLSKGHRQAAAGFDFELGDFTDKACLERVLQKYNFAAVMHFAACTEVDRSVKDPAVFYQNNTAGVLALLNALTAHTIKRFVFSSSAAIFGEPKTDLINENHPKSPINPYGHSKLMVEQMLSDFDTAYGLKYAALRYFNASGSDESGEIGESHSPETHLIARLVQTAAGKQKGFTIFGTDYPTSDGTCIRDFVHVNDLARAHVLALGKLLNEPASLCFNLGSGTGHSVAEVVETVKKVTGRNFDVQTAPRRAGDPARLVADNTKARKVLGWQPTYDLTRIIQTAWQWETHRKY